jgi:P-type conjugative transfer protein TrbJ
MKKAFLPPLLLCALLLAARPAWCYGPIPVIDYAHIVVTTWAEYLRYAQAAYSIVQQATQIYNQIRQIEYQIQALKKLSVHSWRDIGPLYYQLNHLLQQANTLTYAVDDLEAQFESAFPGSTRYASFPDEHSLVVQKTLDSLRLNLVSLHQISMDNQGSLQTLGEIQNHVDAAEGHEEALEALGELGSWQADQLATMGSTLESIANATILAASYQINQDARSKQTETDTVNATLSTAQSNAGTSEPSYTVVPSWMPPQ